MDEQVSQCISNSMTLHKAITGFPDMRQERELAKLSALAASSATSRLPFMNSIA